MLRRRSELVRLGRYRLDHGREVGDVASWALVIADVLAATTADFDFLAFTELADKAGIEIPEDVAMEAIHRVSGKRAEKGDRYRPISSGHAGSLLELTASERIDCQIRTMSAIDESPAERREWARQNRRRRDRQAKAIKRRANGAVTRAEFVGKSVSRRKPWIGLGISRATYYRRLRRSSGKDQEV